MARPSSKTPTPPSNGSDRRLENLNPSKPENRLAAYREDLVKVKKRITELDRLIKNAKALSDREGIPVAVFFEGKRYTISDARKLLLDLYADRARIERNIKSWENLVNPPKSTSGNKGGGNGNPPKGDRGGGDGKDPKGPPVIYNAGAVNDAYFKLDQSFFKKQADPKGYSRGELEIDSYVYSGNTPKATVESAIDLWQNSSSGKGMIQTWQPPGKNAQSSSGETWTSLGTSKTFQRYGFQFIYNPGNISMSYGGVPDIDPSMMSSGTEDYLLQNPSVFKSTISFDILINRMFDMQYLGPGGKLKGDTQASKIYSGKIPTDKDLKKIWNRGTMYDIEFLLQTMFSYEPLSTQLRNKTSDVGYLGAFPVEMHLGNKLRYVVLIDSINVNHVIFDHRMVPLFSNVSISARRMPDYKAGVITDATQSGSSSSSNANFSSTTTADRADRQRTRGGAIVADRIAGR